MANPKSPLPLYEKIYHKNTTQRALDVTILFLLLCLLFNRFLSFKNHGFAWFLAFLCESCFTFIWVLFINMKWTPLTYKTYPQRLQNGKQELPQVDMFVTSADAELEPPLITANTVLSLLAVDYPAHKLACYVSDDGCSPLTYYSLVEASKFAKLWVPFCKKYDVQVRAPFRYFLLGDSAELPSSSSWEFLKDWNHMKEEYEQLSRKIELAAINSASFELTGDFSIFSNTELKNHPPIVKVIWENKEGLSDGVPHLIYISREKRPKHPHHYKAGAMNVLTRVSGLMTNAPFMLNVDCDMYANNPKPVLEAMCLLLGSKERDCAFVQFPQYFYDSSAVSLAIFHESAGKGVVGIQGPFYSGTGTFHRRKVIYGLCPDELEHQDKDLNSVTRTRILKMKFLLKNDKQNMNKCGLKVIDNEFSNMPLKVLSLIPVGKVADDELLKEFGNSKEFIKSAVHALQGKSSGFSSNLSNSLEAAHQVAGCGYEFRSSWGKKFGWLYGSTTEDVLTGLMIHAKGWRSGYCSPDPRAFLGCEPPGGPAVMKQQKRWAMGLLEILFSKHNPVFASIKGKLLFRQCLVYLWLLTWGLRSIPELCYSLLPAYCIITNSSFLPKVQEPGIIIPVALLVIYKLYALSQYIQAGFPIYSWWVNNSMSRITATSALLFAVVNAVLKLLGLSETVFEITQKVHQSSTCSSDISGKDDRKLMKFDESLFFVPGTTILLIHLGALATVLLGLQPHGGHGSGVGEYFCSVYVVLCFLPFLQGLFRKGEYGIPLSTICKSAALSLLFLQICKTSSKN